MEDYCPTPTRAWYAYMGSGDNDYNQPSSYFFMKPKPTCTTGTELCAIYAAYGGDYPSSISSGLTGYIAAGLANHVPQPSSPPGSKKYIYMHN